MVIRTLVNAGHEVIILNLYWVSYSAMVRAAKALPV